MQAGLLLLAVLVFVELWVLNGGERALACMWVNGGPFQDTRQSD